MKMTVKLHLNVKYFTQKTVVLAVVSALMFIVGGFLVKEYKINVLEKKDYGVFLNVTDLPLERFRKYETIVIDAQYFTKKDIELLHQNGITVYTYLNIGSVENFREYYTAMRNWQLAGMIIGRKKNGWTRPLRTGRSLWDNWLLS